MPDLAFVLVARPELPALDAVVASAARVGVTLTDGKVDDGVLSFEVQGGGLFFAALMKAPHPDAPHMASGPTSVSPEEAAAAPAHFIVTAMSLEGTALERDTRMAALASTIVDNVPAVAAMLGHGVVFHQAKLFADLARRGAEQGELPPELAVDITAARESEERMSFLSHGLVRYGREEIYMTCPIRGKGALDFMFSLVRWLLTDREKQLPTGETLGRSDDEKVTIQRVPNPAGAGGDSAPLVIRLDLAS